MTEELKKALESAVTDEQKKAVAEKFKEEIQKLTPEELDKIAGGYGDPILPDIKEAYEAIIKRQSEH